jgi:hypothetical protein
MLSCFRYRATNIYIHAQKKTHGDDEPILAKKRVLQLPAPDKLVFRLKRGTMEGTSEETISNFAVPSFNCLRISLSFESGERIIHISTNLLAVFKKIFRVRVS